MSGIKQFRSWFYTTVGDTKIGGFWTRFVGGGISKPTQQTFENLTSSVPFFKEISSAASVDIGQALENKHGLVVISSNGNAKSGTNTAGGSTGGTVVVQPSHLPTTEPGKLVKNGIDDYSSISGSDTSSITDAQKAILLGLSFDPTASAHIAVTVDPATTTRNKYWVRLSNYTLKFLALLAAAKAPTGGTTGMVLKKNSATDYDSNYANYGYKSVSTSTITIGTGSKVFAVGTGYDYAIGNRIRVIDQNNASNYVEGNVTAYGSGNLTILVDQTSGSGAISSWFVNIASIPYSAPITPGNTYLSTSSSNVTIATGSKSFTIGTGLSYTSGTRVRLDDGTGNYMEGNVTSYNSGTGALIVLVDTIGGSGTINSWIVNIGGSSPLQGSVYVSTSSTSNSIATGSKIFAVGTGYSYAIGNRIRVTDQANSSNYVEGNVTAYSGGNLTVLVDTIGGSGTKTAWNINLGGQSLGDIAFIDLGVIIGGDISGGALVYRKNENGLVTLKGSAILDSSIGSSTQTVATLPSGYRPQTNNENFVTHARTALNAYRICMVTIDISGVIQINLTGTATDYNSHTVYLDGISFYSN